MKKIIITVLTGIVFSYSLKAQCDIRMHDIYTPNGSPVVTFLMCESSAATRNYWDTSIAQDFPYARQIKTYNGYSSTRKFNCHGYAWLRVEQNIDRWIGTGWSQDIVDPEKIYITDGSYTQVSQATYPGKVFWASGDHSAVTTNQSGVVISKWNEYPLVEHALNDSPYGTTNLKYYVKAPITISGPQLVLNAGSTYTLSNTNGALVTWSCSSYLQIQSSSNTSVTVKPMPSNSFKGGLEWIQASVGGGSPVRYEVWVGKPVITGISGSRNPNSSGNFNYYTAVYDERANIPYYSGFEWVLNPSTGCTLYDATTGSPGIIFNSSGNYQLRVRATNVNGTGDYYTIGLNVSNSPSYSPTSTSLYQAYPNPVSDELTVSLRTQLSSVPIQSVGNSAVGKIVYTVYLYNANGASVRQAVSQGDQTQLDVSGLPDGIYYLVIDADDGSKPETHKIIVKQ